MKIIEVETKRGDTLISLLYGEQYKNTCVIITNGTGGNIFENKFARILGEELEKQKISYIYAHNSGAFQMIDFPSKNKNHSGLTYELFDNCIEDLDAYVEFAKKQGYKKIILGGHSYGSNKVVYYLYKTKKQYVDKFILISPTDTEESTDSEKVSIEKLKPIAIEYKEQNKLDETIPVMFDGYNFFTARAFFDFIENPHHHNLPVYSDKNGFNQLKSIKIQGLFVMGQNDGYAKRNGKKHLQVIYENSGNKDNIARVIEDTSHTFRNKEKELAKVIIDFVKEK